MTARFAKDLLPGCALVTRESSLVNIVRDKGADIRMHSAGQRKENSAFRRNGIVTGKEVLKRGKPALSGMGALNRLGKLHWIADEYDVVRAGSHCNDIGDRDLARLIYKQVVEARVEIDARK